MADNPFSGAYNSALDPSNGGTIMGAIGSLIGAPTKSQAQGSATAEALKQLAILKEQGLNPQQAMLKFFQSPQGHDYFTMAGPDGLKSLADGLQAMQPPAPTLHNLGPGGQLYSVDPNTGKPSLIANNPKDDTPSDVKSFQYFTALAKLPQAEIQRLAALQADPSAKDPNSVASKAIDTLVEKYGLPARTGEAMKAGQVKVLPLKNEVGQDTGAVTVVDLTNPGSPSVQVINPGGKGPEPTVPTPMPGVTPDTGAGAGVLPPVEPAKPNKASAIPENNPKYFGNKASMFLASGPIATGLQAASGASEMINPKMIIPQGAQAADRQTMIDTLRSDLAAMGQLGGGIGVNKGVLEGYLKLAPTGGLTESPHQAIQKAIRLSEHIQQEIEAQTEIYQNAKLPLEQRKGAQALIQGWQRVQRDLPTVDELTRMEKAIREGTAGAPTISGAASEIVKAGGKAITEIKREAGKVQEDTGIGTGGVNIDAITDPKELLAIDPRSLSRTDKIKYLRKVDQLTKGKRSGSAVQPR